MGINIDKFNKARSIFAQIDHPFFFISRFFHDLQSILTYKKSFNSRLKVGRRSALSPFCLNFESVGIP